MTPDPAIASYWAPVATIIPIIGFAFGAELRFSRRTARTERTAVWRFEAIILTAIGVGLVLAEILALDVMRSGDATSWEWAQGYVNYLIVGGFGAVALLGLLPLWIPAPPAPKQETDMGKSDATG